MKERLNYKILHILHCIIVRCVEGWGPPRPSAHRITGRLKKKKKKKLYRQSGRRMGVNRDLVVNFHEQRFLLVEYSLCH